MPSVSTCQHSSYQTWELLLGFLGLGLFNTIVPDTDGGIHRPFGSAMLSLCSLLDGFMISKDLTALASLVYDWLASKPAEAVAVPKHSAWHQADRGRLLV